MVCSITRIVSRSIKESVMSLEAKTILRFSKIQFLMVTRPISDVEPEGGRSWEVCGDEWSELGQQQGSYGSAG